jgi:hypothetical protein
MSVLAHSTLLCVSFCQSNDRRLLLWIGDCLKVFLLAWGSVRFVSWKFESSTRRYPLLLNREDKRAELMEQKDNDRDVLCLDLGSLRSLYSDLKPDATTRPKSITHFPQAR